MGTAIVPPGSIRQTLRLSAVWVLFDLRRRFVYYRLGTIWQSLAFALIVALLVTFFGTVFKRDLPGYEIYTRHLAASLAVWMFLSACLNQACSVFGEQVQVLRYAPLPFAVLPLRIAMRNAVIFVQNIVVTLAVALAIGGKPPLFGWLVLGVFLLAANAVWLTQLLALACIRFRDMPQMVSGLLHLAFLLTPILWMDHFLGRYQYLLELQPVFHIMAVVRDPLCGSVPGVVSLGVAAGLAICGGGITVLVCRCLTKRLPYWI